MSLVIIAFVVGGGMVTVGAILERGAYAETRNKLDQFKQAIIGFASRTQRLPKYTGTLATDDEVSPIISSITDFWGNKIVYLYDPELARSDVTSPICAKRSTNLTLRTCENATCSTYADMQNVAFIYFSSSKNLVNQTDASATGSVRTEPAPYLSYSGPVGGFGTANLKTVKTYAPGISVGIYSAPTTSAQAYDDQLVAISLDELRQRLGCSVKPMRLINIDLPMGAQGASYAVDILAEGGVPISSTENYRWCVESSDTGVDSDLAFKVMQRSGAEYSTPRTISRQSYGACVAAIETTSAWGTGDVLRITGGSGGNLSSSGGARTRSIKIYVRDNQNNDPSLSTADTADNIEYRTFVVPINGS